MCDCIAEIIKKTEFENNAVQATVGSFNYQSTEVSYRPFRLDGKPYKHHRYTGVNWKYCPFCGEQIGE